MRFLIEDFLIEGFLKGREGTPGTGRTAEGRTANDP